jgi:hypothetical protein
MPLGLKPRNSAALFGTAEQAAEKWGSGSEFPEKLPSGAKSPALILPRLRRE